MNENKERKKEKEKKKAKLVLPRYGLGEITFHTDRSDVINLLWVVTQYVNNTYQLQNTL